MKVVTLQGLLILISALLLLAPKHCHQASAVTVNEHDEYMRIAANIERNREKKEQRKEDRVQAKRDERKEKREDRKNNDGDEDEDDTNDDEEEVEEEEEEEEEPPTIDVSPSKMKFGKKFKVSFTNAKKNNWIGIYSGRKGRGSDVLWSYLCGEQKKSCSKESGTVEFSIEGPNLKSHQYMPLNPGDYQACLMNNYNSRVCADFKINDIPSALISTTSLRSEDIFGYGEYVSVRFNSQHELPVNSWIGIYKANEVNNRSSQLSDNAIDWAYAGCNNKKGNEYKQEACSIQKTRGTVDNFDKILPVGMYRFCLSFYTNKPYKKFVCSDSFQVKPPRLTVDDEIPFGSDIDVDFRNWHPTKYNWVALYDNKKKEELWASMCGDQKSWNKDCRADERGTLTFSGGDPKQESYKRWPINPGSKSVCIYGAKDGKLELACEHFTVMDIPSSVISGTSVSLSATHFAYKEAIRGSFETPTAYPSTWIGVYKADSVFNYMNKLPEKPIDWVFTSCKNPKGDQDETHSCMKKKEVGDVKINNKTISPGRYKLCMSFYINPPYEEFVCSAPFIVKEPECEGDCPDVECKDDENYSWKIYDGSMEDCGYILQGDLVQDENRLDRWCDASKDDNKLSHCKQTCGTCTSAPSSAPSLTLSPSTPPTSTPTLTSSPSSTSSTPP